MIITYKIKILLISKNKKNVNNKKIIENNTISFH